MLALNCKHHSAQTGSLAISRFLWSSRLKEKCKLLRTVNRKVHRTSSWSVKSSNAPKHYLAPATLGRGNLGPAVPPSCWFPNSSEPRFSHLGTGNGRMVAAPPWQPRSIRKEWPRLSASLPTEGSVTSPAWPSDPLGPGPCLLCSLHPSSLPHLHFALQKCWSACRHLPPPRHLPRPPRTLSPSLVWLNMTRHSRVIFSRKPAWAARLPKCADSGPPLALPTVLAWKSRPLIFKGWTLDQLHQNPQEVAVKSTDSWDRALGVQVRKLYLWQGICWISSLKIAGPSLQGTDGDFPALHT